MNRIYFPSLNGLRFIAAFLVIIHHVEPFKSFLGLTNYRSLSFIYIIGELGVVLFFVLSGFLITYLLLTEEKQTNTISVKSFYLRRILRIWPLYFLIVGIGFFILPHLSFFETNSLESISSHINGAQLSFSEIAPSYMMYNDFGIKLSLFLLLLPNVAYSVFGLITPYATQAWSVGVEEQFYLVWPVLMKKIKNKELLFYFIIGGYLFIKLIVFNLIPIFFSWTDTVEHAWHFFYHTSIDCMAVGGLFALYLFRKDKKLIFLFNRKVQFVTLFALLILIGFGVVIPYIHIEFYAVLFGILILNLAGNPKTIISLENKVFNYLGKISYGLYMYHSIAIMIAIKGLNILGVNNLLLQHLSSLVITIIIAGLSYRFYEKYFINMKVKFSKIVSGDNAVTTSKPRP